MTFKKSSLALLITSAVALTGCLSDNYDYSGGGNTGGGGASTLNREVGLYYPEDPEKDTFSPYDMYAVDKNDLAAIVDGAENSSLDNIQVTGDFDTQGLLEVEITEDKASLIFEANSEYSLQAANANANKTGTLQFHLKMTDYDLGESETRNKIMLTMGSGDTQASVDITSAVVATGGADNTQFIRVPLSCFEEQGIDLNKVDLAMKLESEGRLSYEFEKARIIAGSVTDRPLANNVLACETNSIVELDDESIINRRLKNPSSTEGWAKNITNVRAKSFSPNAAIEGEDNISWTGTWLDPVYNENNNQNPYEPGKSSFMTFLLPSSAAQIDEIPRMDLSHYAAGELQFKLFIPGPTPIPAYDTLNIGLRFETPTEKTSGVAGGINNSSTVYLNLKDFGDDLTANVHNISIPVSEFFIRNPESGLFEMNSIQYVEKLVTFTTTEDVDTEAQDFSGFRYALADVKLVMNPTDTPE